MNNKSIALLIILFMIAVFITGFSLGKIVQKTDDEDMIKNLKLK